jgi:hypothetical protein
MYSGTTGGNHRTKGRRMTKEQRNLALQELALELTVEYAPKHEYRDPDDGSNCFSALGFAIDLLKVLNINVSVVTDDPITVSRHDLDINDNKSLISKEWCMKMAEHEPEDGIIVAGVAAQQESQNNMSPCNSKTIDRQAAYDYLNEKGISHIGPSHLVEFALRYAAPEVVDQKQEPLAWITPYGMKCLKGNASAVCAPQGMRDEDQTIPLYDSPKVSEKVVVCTECNTRSSKASADAERERFLDYWCADIPDYLREKWRQNVNELLDTPNANEKLQVAWNTWKAATAGAPQ